MEHEDGGLRLTAGAEVNEEAECDRLESHQQVIASLERGTQLIKVDGSVTVHGRSLRGSGTGGGHQGRADDLPGLPLKRCFLKGCMEAELLVEWVERLRPDPVLQAKHVERLSEEILEWSQGGSRRGSAPTGSTSLRWRGSSRHSECSSGGCFYGERRG